MANDFDKYKCDISLPDFLIKNFGFQIDKGSSRNNAKLKNDEMTIVIRKNSRGHYTYFDVHDNSRDTRGKTIIDFVQDHLSQSLTDGRKVSLKEVLIFIENYIKTGKTVAPNESTFTLSSETISPEELQKIVLGLKPFTDRHFLHERGITDETINSTLFSDSIYNKDFINPENGAKYTNTVFKMFSQKGVTAISQRNNNLKGCIGSRSESLCATHYDKTKPVDSIYIGESFIDCMSHYQLNKDSLINKNIVYISSEGNLVDSQISLIQSLISNTNPKEIVTLFDNDTQGLFYTTNLIGKLSFPNDNIKDIENTITYKENINLCQINTFKNNSYSSLELIIPVSDSTKTVNTLFESIVHKANGSLKDTFEENTFNSFISYEKDHLIKLCVSFPTSQNAWEKALEMVTEFKLCNSKYLKVEKPLLFDFNDDLTYTIGKNKNFEIKNDPSGKLKVFYKGKPQFNANENLLKTYHIPNNQKNKDANISI